MRGVTCGVPKEHCSGAKLQSDMQLPDKYHVDRDQAFKCMRRYLIKILGYTAIGPREFYKEGHPVLVLTKKIRYGGELRRGKSSGEVKVKRLMPKLRTRGLISG